MAAIARQGHMCIPTGWLSQPRLYSKKPQKLEKFAMDEPHVGKPTRTIVYSWILPVLPVSYKVRCHLVLCHLWQL